MPAPKVITAAATRRLEELLGERVALREAVRRLNDEGHRMSVPSAHRLAKELAEKRLRAERGEPEPKRKGKRHAGVEVASAGGYERAPADLAVASLGSRRPSHEIVAEILARFPGHPPPEAELAAENLMQTIDRLRNLDPDEVSLFRQLSEQHSRNLSVLLEMVPKPEPDPGKDPVNLTMRDAVLHTIRSIVEPTRRKYFPETAVEP